MGPVIAPRLTHQQRMALMYLTQYYAQAGEPCTGGYVARKLNLSRQVARRHLCALERHGLIVSTSCLRPTTPLGIQG